MNIAKLLIYYYPNCQWELVGNDQTDYKNLTWLDKKTAKPTESELLAKKDEGDLREALDNLRVLRNRLLKESDYMGNSDVTMSSAWKTYRQELRDMTDGLDTIDKINNVTWPTEPS